MTDARPLHNFSGDPPASPYIDLYIYYLKGLAKTDGHNFGQVFIGAWLEDGFSFLFFSEESLPRVEQFISTRPDLTLIEEYQMAYSEWQGGGVGARPFRQFFHHPALVGAPRNADG